jgi:hypothetical protein
MRKLLLLSVFFIGIFLSLCDCSNAAADKEEDYELQGRCGKSAAAFFANCFGAGNKYDDFGQTINTYTNHYNKKLNKCFILVDGVTFPNDKKKYHMSRGRTLFDVIENKYYGFFGTGGSEDSQPPCEMLNKECHSEAEWDALVKPYMEE